MAFVQSIQLQNLIRSLSANSHRPYLLLFGIPSPTYSFFPGLKPSFSPNPFHCSPSFLLLKYLLRGFPGLFTVISEHICFLLLVFLCFFYTFQLSVPCGRLSCLMLAFERTLKQHLSYLQQFRLYWAIHTYAERCAFAALVKTLVTARWYQPWPYVYQPVRPSLRRTSEFY